uniref:Uncharacterized protein n=1 Tax=Arundo donax TaxID=35708 RepID=A0A0A9PYI0_ARUDO
MRRHRRGEVTDRHRWTPMMGSAGGLRFLP